MTRKQMVTVTVLLALTAAGLAAAAGEAGRGWSLVGWNDLGMHCMDSDYSLMSILPPYNTIHAQLVDPAGQLVTSPGAITVTYEAVADPTGSVNTTSVGKTDFWEQVLDLFGVSLAPDQGLASFDMPGAGNLPQPMAWHADNDWWSAEGVPITPWDDAGLKNTYPLMRLTARDGSGAILASTDIVLPVSDEMDCRACHGSGTSADAEPTGGWANDPDPERDYRLNLLRLHDQYEAGNPLFAAALAAAGYDPAGLSATAVDGGVSVLCARCHPSNALPGTGVAGVPALTRAVHGRHGGVLDPATGTTLGSATNRSACYRCHPGAATRCLRDPMGAAVAADGSRPIQCQSCHGDLALVGSDRVGWLEEPTCQTCHTGTALVNSGEIRYTTSFTAPGVYRVAADLTFATTPDVPSTGFSLYRFSTGHGGLLCSACHGSPHAILPSSHANDNLQSIALQGHPGTLAECETCHASPLTSTGGPHGMHPVGQGWVEDHPDAGGTLACRACHGTDYRGTVLSRSLGDRVLTSELGARTLWRGYQVSCHLCHDGPSNSDPSPNRLPAVINAAAGAVAALETTFPLEASDADLDPLTLRVVTQPGHGTAWITGSTAHYRGDPGFEGADTFTFAAWDGKADSNLGTASVSVGAALFADGFDGGTVAAWSVVVP